MNRSYGRITWQRNMPVFQMVNESDQFIIYAEPLINLYRNIDKYVRVKRKDNKNNQKTGYYLGEIYGRIEEYEVDEEDYYKLTLHIGKPYKIMQLDEETDTLSDLLVTQEYWFPQEELTKFIECVELMYSQFAHFTMLVMNTEIYIPGEKSLLPKLKTKKKS
jgi:hypothetical protein